MTVVETDQESFTRFVEANGPRMTQALVASLGGEIGREMAAEALAYGWEHWDRVERMANPAGYLYKVGRNRGRRLRRPLLLPDPPGGDGAPLVEPALPAALGALSERQRTCVMLVHGGGWTLTEAAEFLGISPASVLRHNERALSKLRSSLEVTVDV